MVKYRGELDLNGFKISCYVLDDGSRVISGSAMQKSLKMIDEDEIKPSGTRLTRYLTQKKLNPFISKYLDGGHLDPTLGKPIWWTGSKWVDANGEDA